MILLVYRCNIIHYHINILTSAITIMIFSDDTKRIQFLLSQMATALISKQRILISQFAQDKITKKITDEFAGKARLYLNLLNNKEPIARTDLLRQLMPLMSTVESAIDSMPEITSKKLKRTYNEINNMITSLAA